MMKRRDWVLVVGAVVVAMSCADAGEWTVVPGSVSQDSATFVEVLPAEAMDGHDITWGPVSGVVFFPSGQTSPQTGDHKCILHGGINEAWWQGVFRFPSRTIRVQFGDADNNDGLADIFVDDVLEFSIDTRNQGFFTAIGTGLAPTAHTVRIQTRATVDDLILDYVAIDTTTIPTVSAWGLVALTLLMLVAGTLAVAMRRSVATRTTA